MRAAIRFGKWKLFTGAHEKDDLWTKPPSRLWKGAKVSASGVAWWHYATMTRLRHLTLRSATSPVEVITHPVWSPSSQNSNVQCYLSRSCHHGAVWPGIIISAFQSLSSKLRNRPDFDDIIDDFEFCGDECERDVDNVPITEPPECFRTENRTMPQIGTFRILDGT